MCVCVGAQLAKLQSTKAESKTCFRVLVKAPGVLHPITFCEQQATCVPRCFGRGIAEGSPILSISNQKPDVRDNGNRQLSTMSTQCEREKQHRVPSLACSTCSTQNRDFCAEFALMLIFKPPSGLSPVVACRCLVFFEARAPLGGVSFLFAGS